MPIDFQLIEKGNQVTNRAIVSWVAGAGGATASFQLKYKLAKKGGWKWISTTQNSVEIDSIAPGKKLYVQVRAVGFGLPTKKSKWVSKAKVAPSAPKKIVEEEVEQVVSNVSNLSISPISENQATLSWDLLEAEKSLTDLQIIIRRSSKTDGTGKWYQSQFVKKVPATSTSASVPLINGEYIIKVKDLTTKKKSKSQISVVLNIPDATPNLLVETRREDQDSPPFQGKKNRTYYSADFDGLVLDGDSKIDGVGLIDDLEQIDFYGLLEENGVYRFANTKSLPGKFQVTLESIIESRGLLPDNTIDARLTLVDSWYDWDGSGLANIVTAADFATQDDRGESINTRLPYENRAGTYPTSAIRANGARVTVEDLDTTSLGTGEVYQVLEANADESTAQIYFRASDSVPENHSVLLEANPDTFLLENADKLLQESTISFGPWAVLGKNTFVGRTFQFKAKLESNNPDETPLLDELGYKMTIAARTESSSSNIASGASAKAVTFTNAFYQEPTVGITAFNLASGDYYELTSVTRTGFTVHFKNSSNSSVDRNFQYVAAGFGSEQT